MGEEHETAQIGCSQQCAALLGFLEAVQWAKLSSRTWQQWGTLNPDECWASSVGDVELRVPSQVKLPGTY